MPPVPNAFALQPWRVITVGFRALCGSTAATNTFAAADFELELHHNNQLAQASSEVKAESHAHSEALVIKRMSRLRGVLFKSFASMISAVGLAYLLNATGYFISTSAAILSVASVFCFAWGTLSRLGWTSQSYKGDTAVERLDQYLFHLLYWLGMYFATAALL